MVSGKYIILFIALLLLFPAFVSADTYLNITITEQATQNVTFAEFFYLEETVYAALIEGFVNITNPSTEPVYDTMIKLENLANLATNVTHYNGRHGVQSSGLTTENVSVTYGAINRTPQPFVDQDLDRDNRTDFIWINRTHLVLDFSTETQLITYALADPADEDPHAIAFEDEPIVSSYGEVIGWVDGTYAFNDPWQIDANQLTIIQAPNPDYVIVHVPELRPGESSVFTYNATGLINPPLDVDTDYIHDQYTKVLAGECFQVIQNATNEFEQGLDLYDVNITMTMQPVEWNGTESNFSFDQLYLFGDYTNVDNVSEHNQTWYWGVNGGTVPHGDMYYINYSVCAPDTVPNSSTYLFLEEELNYRTPGTITGISLDDVKARADMRFNFTKRIDRPTDTEENRDVIWEVEPSIVTSTPIDFNVTKISLWVTSTENPNDKTVLKERYFPTDVVNESNRWNSYNNLGERWYFNYTDGSHPTLAPPPIVWMIPYHHIADINDQIIRVFETKSGEDYYFKYIYVVNGYWLEIEKNVTNIGGDEYNVSLFVWNRGPGYTPRDLTVTVYDFVPVNFTARDFTEAFTQSSAVSGSFDGTAYNWDIPPQRTVQNASFAPVGEVNSTWNVSYVVDGEGEYRISDLYIVGLDPRLVDGGSSSEVISVLSSMVSRSTEGVYVLIVFALVAINVLNYVLTKKKD
ncbi:MAG: hypothetical protein ACOCUR_00050 [Nanoarchaeota archaeon]